MKCTGALNQQLNNRDVIQEVGIPHVLLRRLSVLSRLNLQDRPSNRTKPPNDHTRSPLISLPPNVTPNHHTNLQLSKDAILAAATPRVDLKHSLQELQLLSLSQQHNGHSRNHHDNRPRQNCATQVSYT